MLSDRDCLLLHKYIPTLLMFAKIMCVSPTPLTHSLTCHRYLNALLRFRRTRTQGPLNIGGLTSRDPDGRDTACPDIACSEELAE